MEQKLDVTFEINRVKLRIVEDDLVRTSADVMVSSDDIFLSRSGGVSRTLNDAAGDSLNEDIQKISIPLTLGSVVVTGAGRLPAKYIFHATTNDFSTRPSMPALIAHLTRRILEIAVALEVKHIALPLLGTGYAGFSPQRGLACIFGSIAYYVTANNFSGIDQISIVIFGSPEVRPAIDDIKKKMQSAEKTQQRIDKFRAICAEMPEDEALNELLSTRIFEAMQALRQLFYFDEIDSSLDFSQGGGVLSKEEYREAKSRLEQAIAQVNDKITSKQKLLEIHQRRLQMRREEQALKGISAPPEIVIEIEDLNEQIEKLRHELVQMRVQHSIYQQELDTLNTRVL